MALKKYLIGLVRYERCINAGMKPELVNATLKQVNKQPLYQHQQQQLFHHHCLSHYHKNTTIKFS